MGRMATLIRTALRTLIIAAPIRMGMATRTRVITAALLGSVTIPASTAVDMVMVVVMDMVIAPATGIVADTVTAAIAVAMATVAATDTAADTAIAAVGTERRAALPAEALTSAADFTAVAADSTAAVAVTAKLPPPDSADSTTDSVDPPHCPLSFVC